MLKNLIGIRRWSMKIKISRSDPNILLRDLFDLFENHAKSTIADADHKIIVVEDPDDYLLEELDSRGVEYEIIES